MICTHCKKEIPDNSAFCPECGKKLGQVEAQTEILPDPMQSEKTDKKARKKLLIGIAVGVCVIAVIVFVALKFIKPTVDLNKYVSVTFSGYDTAGEATVEFDKEQFQKKYKGKLPSDFIDEYVTYHLDKKEDLCNGDTVVLSWECDDEKAEKYGYKLKHEDSSFSVTGLTDIDSFESFDPFEGIDVVFEGVSGEGFASVVGVPKLRVAQELIYSCDKMDEICNGDVITLSVTYGLENPTIYCIENYQLRPSAVTKTYTVSGLDEYVAELSDITDTSWTELQKDAQKRLDTYVEDYIYADGETFKEAVYKGSYLLTRKPENSYGANNALYLVYELQIAHYKEYENMTYDKIDNVYWYVRYTDLFMGVDGAVKIDQLTGYTPDNYVSIHPDGSQYDGWGYNGYLSMDDLFEDTVTENQESYYYEDGILKD